MKKAGRSKAAICRINKRKGFDAERELAKRCREELDYTKCITAREGSRLHDRCKIDLIFLPFLPQIKCGEQKYMNVKKHLDVMREKIREHFPNNAPEITMPRMLIHRKDIGTGKKDTPEHTLVWMYEREMNDLLFNERGDDFEPVCLHQILIKDHRGLICMTFNNFKELINDN